jgi:hypothetical protein
MTAVLITSFVNRYSRENDGPTVLKERHFTYVVAAMLSSTKSVDAFCATPHLRTLSVSRVFFLLPAAHRVALPKWRSGPSSLTPRLGAASGCRWGDGDAVR